ncbi:MAG: flagellar assembly protein FliX [Rhodospirillales bacterium]|nr:flagellar assembly protein FliX [Rhodospirillales bacterium]
MRPPIVDRARPLAAAQRKPGSRSASAAGFSALLESAAPEAAEEPAGVAPPTPLAALLGVQEIAIDEGQSRRQATTRYGAAILERLEQLRGDILGGGVAPSRLADLARTMRSERRRAHDPHLDGIIDEIELRAEVEIAKLTRSP